MREIAFFIIPFILFISACVQAEKTGDPAESLQAPEFSLEDLNGNPITLSSLKGKVVFLNLWATWCPPCVREIPDFIDTYTQYKDKGLEIIGISVDNEGTAKVLKFVEQYKINYPIVMYTMQFIRDYMPGNAIPVTFIIDPQGKIRYKKIGLTNKAFLENWFLKLIEEK